MIVIERRLQSQLRETDCSPQLAYYCSLTLRWTTAFKLIPLSNYQPTLARNHFTITSKLLQHKFSWLPTNILHRSFAYNRDRRPHWTLFILQQMHRKSLNKLGAQWVTWIEYTHSNARTCNKSQSCRKLMKKWYVRLMFSSFEDHIVIFHFTTKSSHEEAVIHLRLLSAFICNI